jgi:acetolactate synthase-1/2/3 large subunit
MVRQWQKLFFGGRMASTDKSLHTKDFVKAAQADGFRYAVRLADKADVPRVVQEWLSFDGPAFLEVMIDPDAGVYPMVPPGAGYDQMITGDAIRARAVAPVIEKPDASEMF